MNSFIHKEGMTPNLDCLVFTGSSRLSDYNTQESTLHLALRLCGGLQIFVKTVSLTFTLIWPMPNDLDSLTGKTIILEVESSDTIDNARVNIQDKVSRLTNNA